MAWRSSEGSSTHRSVEELEDLIRSVSPDLLGYLVRWTQPVDDAADVLAETLVVAWRRRHDIPAGHDHARAWLFVVARNTLANHRRGQLRRRALADRLRVQLAGYDEGGPVGDEQTERVRAALGTLPLEDQELITLIIWDGLAVAEAGQVLELPASTARSRYARARTRLARALAGQERP